MDFNVVVVIIIIIIIIIIITIVIYYYDFLGAEHFEELVSVVKEHCLFKEALKLYPKSSEQYRVCILTLLFRLLRQFPLIISGLLDLLLVTFERSWYRSRFS